MIQKPTVVVLGAGASLEYGFPSGWELVHLLSIADQAGNLSGPMAQLLALGYPENDVRQFAQALRLSGRPSVDAFLEHRPNFLEIGKAAIAAALIPRESQFNLFAPPHGKKSLYGYFWEKMNAKPHQFAQNQVKFITFNYDRSLEEYLSTAMSNSFGLTRFETAEILGQISINHVHGTLGNHPAFHAERTREYQSDYTLTELTLAAGEVRIIHEQNAESEAFLYARATLYNAEQIVFLGFGYDQTNLERLKVRSIPVGAHIYGTAFGLSDIERASVEARFDRRITLGEREDDAHAFMRETVQLQ